MTLRTVSDVMCALGYSLAVSAGPLEVSPRQTNATRPAAVTGRSSPRILSFSKATHKSKLHKRPEQLVETRPKCLSNLRTGTGG